MDSIGRYQVILGFYSCKMSILLVPRSVIYYLTLSILLLQVDDEAMELNKELVSKLLELDDVDAVYTDQK